MKLSYKVHSALETESSTVATVKGTEMKVVVPCYEMVLTDAKGDQGSIVLRFSGPDYESAKKLFKDKEEVTVTLS